MNDWYNWTTRRQERIKDPNPAMGHMTWFPTEATVLLGFILSPVVGWHPIRIQRWELTWCVCQCISCHWTALSVGWREGVQPIIFRVRGCRFSTMDAVMPAHLKFNTHLNHYLMFATSGSLNQQKTGGAKTIGELQNRAMGSQCTQNRHSGLLPKHTMNAIKSLQSFSPSKCAFLHMRKLLTKKSSLLSFCNSKSEDSGSEPSPPEGDLRRQELLARIAMLQAQKVRLTDYLDERSDYLSKFAEDANKEFDEVGENALKELDEAGARIMENLESRMQAFEESAELNKQEIDKNEMELVQFEGQIEDGRNEGLFFKNLRQNSPGVRAKEEIEKINKVNRENAGSKIRKYIYLALIGLLIIGIANALISSSSDLRKVAILGVILVALLFQFIYEQKISSKIEKTGEDDRK